MVCGVWCEGDLLCFVLLVLMPSLCSCVFLSLYYVFRTSVQLVHES